MSAFPPGRPIELPELSLHVHEQGDGPAVVLCHGFPELAYSWRHQITALAQGGFRAIAPDQRGYGGSDVPKTIEAYDLEHLAGDLAALLDALEIEQAVFAGHDWGGFVAWAMPLLFPERCLGVIGVNTPYMPFPTTDLLRLAYPDPEKLYILWFQEPGVAESVLERDPQMVFQKLMRRGTPPTEALDNSGDANPFRRLDELEDLGSPMLSEEEIDVYTQAFEKSGFFGPISWYRNIDRNKELVPDIGVRKLDLPCLQIGAAWDRALSPELAAGMSATCSDLEVHTIPDCGHWTQQEKPEELSALMLDWLRRRIG